MPVYAIRDWQEHFENNRTRDLKSLNWVPIPNKHDGDGYTFILDHPNGAAHFGAWCAMVQVASKCDPRGTLVRDAADPATRGGKKPHDSRSLARITRIPAEVFDEAIPRLIEIGWLVGEATEVDGQASVTASPQEGAGIPQEGAALGPQESALEGKGMEQKGREGNGTEGKGINTGPAGAGPRRAGEQLDTAAGTQLRRDEVTTAINRVVEHYQSHHPRAKPGDRERKKIRDRLRDGYSVAELRGAIDGCHRSPHHCGENEKGVQYQSLELIMRDSTHVQTFLEIPVGAGRRRREAINADVASQVMQEFSDE